MQNILDSSEIIAIRAWSMLPRTAEHYSDSVAIGKTAQSLPLLLGEKA
ncbi:MAG: hypothetical protein KUG78_13380 [Kangiellaceae bacterium]|nr:hypothetical protein [Kangiellaceae bacterium]